MPRPDRRDPNQASLGATYRGGRGDGGGGRTGGGGRSPERGHRHIRGRTPEGSPRGDIYSRSPRGHSYSRSRSPESSRRRSYVEGRHGGGDSRLGNLDSGKLRGKLKMGLCKWWVQDSLAEGEMCRHTACLFAHGHSELRERRQFFRQVTGTSAHDAQSRRDSARMARRLGSGNTSSPPQLLSAHWSQTKDLPTNSGTRASAKTRLGSSRADVEDGDQLSGDSASAMCPQLHDDRSPLACDDTAPAARQKECDKPDPSRSPRKTQGPRGSDGSSSSSSNSARGAGGGLQSPSPTPLPPSVAATTRLTAESGTRVSATLRLGAQGAYGHLYKPSPTETTGTAVGVGKGHQDEEEDIACRACGTGRGSHTCEEVDASDNVSVLSGISAELSDISSEEKAEQKPHPPAVLPPPVSQSLAPLHSETSPSSWNCTFCSRVNLAANDRCDGNLAELGCGQPRTNSVGIYTIHCQCRDSVASAVIGRGGERKREIMRGTDVHSITIGPRPEPHGGEQSMAITGRINSIRRAINLIRKQMGPVRVLRRQSYDRYEGGDEGGGSRDPRGGVGSGAGGTKRPRDLPLEPPRKSWGSQRDHLRQHTDAEGGIKRRKAYHVPGERRLFIDRLKGHTSEDALREYAQQFGEVTDATMCLNGHGFGFVTFKDCHDAEKALTQRSKHTNSSIAESRVRS